MCTTSTSSRTHISLYHAETRSVRGHEVLTIEKTFSMKIFTYMYFPNNTNKFVTMTLRSQLRVRMDPTKPIIIPYVMAIRVIKGSGNYEERTEIFN